MARGLKIVAWGYILGSGVVLGVGFPLGALLVAADPRRTLEVEVFGALFAFAALIVLLPAFAGGIGTLRGRPWGPIALAYASVLLLFAVPIGTILGALSLMVLVPEVRRQRAELLRDPFATGRVVPGFENWPAGPWAKPVPAGGPRDERGAAMPAATAGAAPAPRRSPAPDATTRLVTCEHLRPIEAAMRGLGIPVRSWSARRVAASCVVDQLALGRRFGTLEPVRYAEQGGASQGPEDPPRAVLWCDACESSIEVIHPGEYKPGTPVFPEPAAR